MAQYGNLDLRKVQLLIMCKPSTACAYDVFSPRKAVLVYLCKPFPAITIYGILGLSNNFQAVQIYANIFTQPFTVYPFFSIVMQLAFLQIILITSLSITSLLDLMLKVLRFQLFTFSE